MQSMEIKMVSLKESQEKGKATMRGIILKLTRDEINHLSACLKIMWTVGFLTCMILLFLGFVISRAAV